MIAVVESMDLFVTKIASAFHIGACSPRKAPICHMVPNDSFPATTGRSQTWFRCHVYDCLGDVAALQSLDGKHHFPEAALERISSTVTSGQ
jgi:hypothetical protein